MRPADGITLAVLGVVVATLGVRATSGIDLGRALALHAALLAGYAALAFIAGRLTEGDRGSVLRAMAVVGVMFTLYTTLGHVAFEAIPWRGDALLAEIDRALFFGVSPAIWVAPRIGTAATEAFSFIYALFIPYLYMSIFLGLIGRPAREREAFFTGFALLYAASFLGYLFVPARGPIVHQAADFPGPLAGGYFHGLVVSAIDRMGGPHGAFPSLHVGASAFACAFDLRHNRLRGLIYLPVVALIGVATIVLRFHYVVDLVAGFALALAALKGGHGWSGWRETSAYTPREGFELLGELRTRGDAV